MTRTPTGLIPILATPFTAAGDLDRASLRTLVEFQLACGVDGVAVFGMASEGFALTAAERTTILRDVRAVAGPSVPIIAGVNGTSTVTALEQAHAATAAGADQLMVLPPFLAKPTPAQVVDFFTAVADESEAPVMLQDAPAVTGVTIDTPTITTLSTHPSITSIKVEAPPTPVKIAAVSAAISELGSQAEPSGPGKRIEPVAPDGQTELSGPGGPTEPSVREGRTELAVLGGQNAQAVLEEYANGAVGTMPACEFADPLRAVLDDLAAGRQAAARAGFARLLPLILLGVRPGQAWAVHKEVLHRRGIIATPTVRLPARPLDPVTARALDETLAELDLPTWPSA